jgi:hypothetical protein
MTPIPINFDPAQAPVGVAVEMVGFGANEVGGSFGAEYVVQQTSTPCSKGSDTNLLCFDQVNGTGACYGDSGGPSLVTVAGGLLQVGIASFGDQACLFSAPTRVDAELAFLAKHVLVTCPPVLRRYPLPSLCAFVLDRREAAKG